MTTTIVTISTITHISFTEIILRNKKKALFFPPLCCKQLFESGLSKHEPCAFDKYVCLISSFPLLFIQLHLGPKQ